MFLMTTWEIVASILASITTLLTVIFIPFCVKMKKRVKEAQKNRQTIEQIPTALASIDKKLTNLENNIEELKDEQNHIITQQEEQEKRFSQLETMQLKHMINDAFYGYGSVRDIPDEELISASQCADLYLAKGLNHETGARCEIIYEELKRRQRERSGIDG